ncbi:cytochrome c [Ruegeria aquimaris]|uniref:Cytochrome c n=1 Tax=Ruegeria aquimaris TaxID=2984333 RepID=A0ABT3AEQ4_9RHOB|nr:cytochrome c [Ruegeria sp. XHP0148]MCV2886777.1 cytochrome c [Ruegeria sp. XHP0148]
MRHALLCLTLLASATPCAAQEAIGLASPEAVARSGLLQHILPRFSLKTGIRVIIDSEGPMELTTVTDDAPVFRRGDVVYFLHTDGSERQERFHDWLQSDIGKRTIEAFVPQDGPAFSASFETAEPEAAPQFDGNAALGAQLSLEKCGRCHVVGEQNRMKGIGSTPSFGVLRALSDWDSRFQSFYALRPHPAFTQVEGITAPFDAERPSPIYPVTLTPEELEAILAFVAATGAADLGAPLIMK